MIPWALRKACTAFGVAPPWALRGRSVGVPWALRGRSVGAPWALPEYLFLAKNRRESNKP